MLNKFKKGDRITIITGKDKGKVSTVLKLLPASNKVIVSGIGICKKHIKSNKSGYNSNTIKKEKYINVSNIMHCNIRGNKSKMGVKYSYNGNKVRYLKKFNETLLNKK